MKETRSELLQVRITRTEQEVIKGKADILGVSVADYVRECCLYSNATAMFMQKLHKHSCSK